jgi:hypothetical protein
MPLDARVSALRETAVPLNEAQRARVLALGTDLRGLWQHPAAPVDLKKRILRTVLEEIVVNHTDDSRQHVLQLHWKGGVHTELRVTSVLVSGRPFCLAKNWGRIG